MKTLINKDNPQIRITAPEIEVQEESDMYFIPVSDYCIPMCIDDWTLVEEEPKHTEVWVEGRTIFEQEGEPTEGIKENLEENPSNVDLEKEIKKSWKHFSPLKFGLQDDEEYVTLDDMMFDSLCRKYYRLGQKRR